MRNQRSRFAVLALFVAGAGLLSACSTLPPLNGRTASSFLTDTSGTGLGQAVAPMAAAHPGASGLYALVDDRQAFAARVLLADTAERSLDVQYYIWRNDITGVLLFDALRAAAERGVRVRMLLDDNSTEGLDATLAMLDSHPNIEVRLFNPFVLRSPRILGYLSDFPRLNRRMHNKSFTADNQATIIGGRNIGDEYFGAAGEMLFIDLDVIAVGPVVGSVSADFDRYWNSSSAYPLRLLVPPISPDSAAGVVAEAARIAHSPAAHAYQLALRESTFVAELAQQRLPLDWAVTRLVSDDPAKVLGLAPPESRLFPQLRQLIGAPVAEVDLVSPYFVPGQTGTDAFTAMSRGGPKVRILTNSLEATDVAVVHAGYAKWRKPLLAAGVSLFELRRTWPRDGAQPRAGPIGSSASSLHAKTFSVDQSRVFIGSYNFDPRSARLNTEMGFVIDSPVLAKQLADSLERNLPERAFEVRLAPDGALYWIERGPGGTVRYDTEPGTGFWKRIGVRLLSLLPIEWLL
jgi:putative cardiolipin synthase